MASKIIAVYEKEESKKEIINKISKYSFDELPKHFHLDFSVMEKLTNINLIKETFQKFELIKTIELRENDKKQKYYSLNYELEDNTFVIISISLENEKPFVINAFHAKRNYKQFEKSLRKNYSDKFI